MKVWLVVSLCALVAMLGSCWQYAAAEVAPLRAIEIAELGRTLDPAVLAFLDGPPAIAARAALAVGRIHKAQGAPALLAHLGAADPGLRTMCAYGLGLLTAGDALDRLRELARRDANSAVRFAAIDAIGRIVAATPALVADRAAADDLIDATQSDSDATVRGHAAAQLEAFRNAAFAKVVEAALERSMHREGDQNVRWHVMWAIARGFAGLADRGFLTAELHDPNETVRLEAARAWGRRTDRDAASVLAVALGDRSWRVQYEALEATRRLRKLPPSEHLTAVAPGIALPLVPPAVVTSVAPPAPLDAAAQKLLAPDAGTINLESFVPPSDAAAMTAGRSGPHERYLIRTTKGDLTIALYREWAPSTVANFVTLAGRGYYDRNRWFRIVPDFVAQTGDPSDNGEGDAGYSIAAEENPIEQRSGVIAMGLNYENGAAQRDSAGTQFYITLSPQLHLDRDFSVFGEVVAGFDVLAHLVESDRIVSVAPVPE